MQVSWFFIPVMLFFIFGPFGRRRWRGRGWNRDWSQEQPEDPSRAREREQRERLKDEQIESLETRVNELESRLDYAERLLTQRRDSQAISGGSAHMAP